MASMAPESPRGKARMVSFLEEVNLAGKRRTDLILAREKAKSLAPLDPAFKEVTRRIENWRQSVIETLAPLPLIPTEFLEILADHPDQPHISVLMFSAYSADTIVKLDQATRHLNRVNTEAFPLVRQSLPLGGLDVISSYLITLTRMIPAHDGDNPFNEYARKSLKKIVSKISKAQLLSEALTERCEHLARRKDRILGEYGSSEYLVVTETENPIKTSKQRVQEIKTTAIPIMVRRCGEICVNGNPWGKYDWLIRECIILFIIWKVETTFKSWIAHLSLGLKILKNTHLRDVESLDTLTVDWPVDRIVLSKMSKCFDDAIVVVLEAAARSHLGFTDLIEYKRCLTQTSRYLNRTPRLPTPFVSLEFYIFDKEFKALFDSTQNRTIEILSKFRKLAFDKPKIHLSMSWIRQPVRKTERNKPQRIYERVIAPEPRYPSETVVTRKPYTRAQLRKPVKPAELKKPIAPKDSDKVAVAETEPIREPIAVLKKEKKTFPASWRRSLSNWSLKLNMNN